MAKYTVAHVGLGGRGRDHLKAFLANDDRFELVALCDMDEKRLKEGAEQLGITATTYTDADKMLTETKPDVYCFATSPHVRQSLAELGVKHKVKAMAFEKPMATSLEEAWTITDMCVKNNIKTIISHQHKYSESKQKMKEIVDAGEIGEVTDIKATCRAWLSQLGTHYMDYMIWANNGARAKWVVGHVHGTKLLSDAHPSPDYILGHVLFENGVRGTIGCGYLSPQHLDDGKFWTDDRLTVYGTHGYAWADCDNHWAAFTKSSGGKVISGEGALWSANADPMQQHYIKDLADWLDDDKKPHPCCIELAYHGYEILEGVCLSSLNNTRIDLPLPQPTESIDINEVLRKALPEVPDVPDLAN